MIVHTKTRNELEQAVELPRTSWSYLERAGTTLNKVEQRERDELSNQLPQKTSNSQVETVRTIPLPDRARHQQQLMLQRAPSQMFVGGTTWNDMKPVTRRHTKRTFITQYCVYNQPAEYNLQIPIVTKTFTLDVGKVSQIRLCFTYALNKKAQHFQ